jgi:hypothetical protein
MSKYAQRGRHSSVSATDVVVPDCPVLQPIQVLSYEVGSFDDSIGGSRGVHSFQGCHIERDQIRVEVPRSSCIAWISYLAVLVYANTSSPLVEGTQSAGMAFSFGACIELLRGEI